MYTQCPATRNIVLCYIICIGNTDCSQKAHFHRKRPLYVTHPPLLSRLHQLLVHFVLDVYGLHPKGALSSVCPPAVAHRWRTPTALTSWMNSPQVSVNARVPVAAMCFLVAVYRVWWPQWSRCGCWAAPGGFLPHYSAPLWGGGSCSLSCWCCLTPCALPWCSSACCCERWMMTFWGGVWTPRWVPGLESHGSTWQHGETSLLWCYNSSHCNPILCIIHWLVCI